MWFLIAVAIIGVLWIMVSRSLDGMDTDTICTSCGTVGKTKSTIKGSIAIEIILWICFIIPGIIYSFWRSGSRKKVCAACSHDTLIPIQSPEGQRLIEKFKAE